jgi:hypothetical protein
MNPIFALQNQKLFYFMICVIERLKIIESGWLHLHFYTEAVNKWVPAGK